MAIIRVNKTSNYTVMSNAHFREKDMSLKAKGLLSLMLSLPDSWNYSVSGLCAICKENETAIKTTLNELKAFGYLEVKKLMSNESASGRIEYEYTVFECPQNQAVEKQGVENLPLEILPVEKQGVENLPLEILPVENQGVENLPLEILPVENQGQLNTNTLTTKKSNTNRLSTKKESKQASDSFDCLISDYSKGDKEITELLQEWLKVRKAKRAAMTDKAIELNLNKLDRLAAESRMSVPEYLREVICRGWQAFYPISNYQPRQQQRQQGNNVFLDMAKEEGLF